METVSSLDSTYKEIIMYRIGFSEDIHEVVEGRKLVLAGVDFPEAKGLLGHSDADVVTHAIAESILGALSLGDLGSHFPDNDPEAEGISSLIILDEIVRLMENESYKINNLDVQVACKAPKLANHIFDMRKVIAEHLHTDIKNVSIKACSYNKVGPIGKGEAIKASSIVLLTK